MTTRILAGILIGGAIGATMGHFGKCSSGACPLTANPFRGAIYGALMGALISFSLGQTQSISGQDSPGQAPTAEESAGTGQEKQSALLHITTPEGFQKQVLEAKSPCLADFYSNSCPPCRMLGPTIETLADKYKDKAVVCKVSLDHRETQGLAQKYGIRGIPAVLFFKDGQETERLVGLRSEEEYAGVLDKLISQ